MDKLLQILEALKPGVDYENETNLVTSKILDSLTIVELIEQIEDAYDIEVTMEEFISTNFESVTKIYEMIQRLS